MANRYWVGGAGTWDTTSTTHWSDTSGGPSGFSAPTISDDVFFDANSGTGVVTTVGFPGSPVANSVTYDSTTLTSLDVLNGFNITSATSGLFTITSGTVNFDGYISLNRFFSNNSNTRSIGLAPSSSFAYFNLYGSGTVWDVQGSNLTFTISSSQIKLWYIGTSAITVNHVTTGATSAPNLLFGNLGSSNYPLTIGSGSSFYSMDFTNFTGSWTTGSSSYTIAKDLKLVSGMSFNGSGSTFIVNVQSVTGGLLTTVGNTFDSFIINTVSTVASFTQVDDCTMTGTLTITQGSWQANGHNLTMQRFVSNNTNTRSLSITSSVVTITGSGLVWDTTTSTNFTLYGNTNPINITYSGSSAVSIINGTGGSFANAASFNFTAGTYPLTLSSNLGILNFTGFAGTWSPGTSSYTFYGSLTLSSAMTFTTPTSGTWTYASGFTGFTCYINTAGKTLFRIASFINVTLQSNLTLNSSYAFSGGTLNLNGYVISSTSFNSTVTTSRTLAFSGGSISVTGTGTVWNSNGTGFSYTGTSLINVLNNTATATTISAHTSGGTEANALNFNVSVGTYSLVLSNASVVKSLNFTGFTGTWSPTVVGVTFYGDLTLVSGMTVSGATTIFTFGSTAGTQTITSAGKTLGAITQSGTGGTVSLLGNLALTSQYTHTSGTLTTNNYNITTSSFNSNNSNVRALNLGSSSITLTGTSGWALTTSTNMTLNSGTSTITLANATASTTQTFAGGGLTYYNLVIGSPSVASQTFSFTGSNTFSTISSTKTVAFTMTLSSSTTTTCANWTINGTLGNVVTLNASVPGVAANLTKTGGSTITVNYFSIKDSSATPSSTWYATNSTNVSNNSGWNFGAPPLVAGGNFFLLF